MPSNLEPQINDLGANIESDAQHQIEAELSNLTLTNTKLRAEIDKLSKEADKLAVEKDYLIRNRKILLLTAIVAVLVASSQILTSIYTYATYSSERRVIDTNISTLKAQIDNLETDKHKKTAEVNQLQTQIDDLKTQKAGILADLETQKAGILASLRQQVSDLEQKKSAALLQLDLLRKDTADENLEARRRQLKQIEQEIGERTQELGRITESMAETLAKKTLVGYVCPFPYGKQPFAHIVGTGKVLLNQTFKTLGHLGRITKITPKGISVMFEGFEYYVQLNLGGMSIDALPECSDRPKVPI